MPNVSQNTTMTNAQFRQSDILKFIQENGTRVLWREVNGLDYITKKGPWKGGKECRYHLTVDAGGLAFGGLAQTAGVFAPNDQSYGIQGFYVPKHQTMTMYFERILDKMSDSEKKAFVNNMKQEYSQKVMFQKSFVNLQQMSDGTGRFATPVGFGPNNTASGATFTIGNPQTLLKVKLSSLSTAVGGAPYLMEGMVISFAFPSYDENTDGTAELTNATCIPRLLALAFNTAGGNLSWYDAFRVVKISQVANEVFLAPARKAAPDAAAVYAPYSTWDASHHVQQGASANMWCAGTGTVTVTPYLGRKFDLSVPADVNPITDFIALFSPASLTSGAAATQPTAIFAVVPGYLPTGSQSYGYGNTDFSSFAVTTKTSDEIARYVLGLGWDFNVDPSNASSSVVDVSLINPFLMTGLDTLVYNNFNIVQGIPRSSIQQYLPTERDNAGNPLTFNSLYGLLTEHVTRNRDKNAEDSGVTEYNSLLMNPIVFSSLLSLSETDRMITDDKDYRGSACKAINFLGKKYVLESNAVVRTDRIMGLPKDCIHMYGNEMEPVAADGQKSFLALNSSGRRTNALENYFTMTGEQFVDNPRRICWLHGFSINVL